MADTDPMTPEPRRFSISIPWVVFIVVASIGLFFAAARVLGQRNFLSEILGLAGVLSGSILGITVSWSTGCRSMFASIVGGGVGCAVALGASSFFGPLLIPPEPGTVYKFGQGIGGAIAGLLGGSLAGGICGGFFGMLAGVAWAMRVKSKGKDFVLLSMLYAEKRSWPDARRVEPTDTAEKSKNNR